jgi:branched-chain amino acid transport system substrate-binding protein
LKVPTAFGVEFPWESSDIGLTLVVGISRWQAVRGVGHAARFRHYHLEEKMRSYFKLLTLLLIFMMVLAACGGDEAEPAASEDETVTTTEEESSEEEEATTEEEEVAEPEMGTIVLGAAVSDTGKYAREGQDTRQGYDTWLDWVNNEYGGIKVGDASYQVEIVYYDDEGDPDTVANLVEKLITEDEVDFLLGPYSSGLTMSASAIAEKYDIIMVEGNGASEGIFERGFKNIFAVLTPAGNYTQSALEALAGQGATSVVVAYEDTAFPTSVAQGAIRWAEEYGMEVLAVETYPKDVADVSAIMTKFRDLEPDVFVGGGHFNDALLFVSAAQELGFNPKGMVITVGPSNPDFAAEVGSAANYILGPTQWEATMSWEDEYFGTAAEFAARYEAMWGEPPTYQAAESTATALALQLAIEQAGSLEMADVRQALYDLDVETFYGPINFDETGKNAGKPMGAIQIQDGVINVVAPSVAAVADLMYPMVPWEER